MGFVLYILRLSHAGAGTEGRSPRLALLRGKAQAERNEHGPHDGFDRAANRWAAAAPSPIRAIATHRCVSQAKVSSAEDEAEQDQRREGAVAGRARIAAAGCEEDGHLGIAEIADQPLQESRSRRQAAARAGACPRPSPRSACRARRTTTPARQGKRDRRRQRVSGRRRAARRRPAAPRCRCWWRAPRSPARSRSPAP